MLFEAFFPSYTGRLCIFVLKSLECRRAEVDQILCFKILNGFCAIKSEDIFSWAPIQVRRPNSLQLARRRCKNNVLNSFPFRVVRIWNNQSQEIVNARTRGVFAAKLRRFDLAAVMDFLM